MKRSEWKTIYKNEVNSKLQMKRNETKRKMHE